MALPAGDLIAKQRHIPPRDSRGVKGHHLICFRIRPFAIEGRFASITWNNALTCLTVNNRRYLEPRKRLLFDTCMFSSLAICTQARFQKFFIRERGRGRGGKFKKKYVGTHHKRVYKPNFKKYFSDFFLSFLSYITLFSKIRNGGRTPSNPNPLPEIRLWYTSPPSFVAFSNILFMQDIWKNFHTIYIPVYSINVMKLPVIISNIHDCKERHVVWLRQRLGFKLI